jgi:ubiquinone/menaquinone biosynthesis C-methylase UbiE
VSAKKPKAARPKKASPRATHPGAAWDALAPWWKATFTDGADVEYELQILPLISSELKGARRVLDLGCGEGHVARTLSNKGATNVVGIDPSTAQLQNALALERSRPGDRSVAYARAMGESLPFSQESFDAIVCCLAIEHATNVDAVLGEAARVLADDGCFLLLVNHPMYQGEGSGFVDDEILGEQYWRVGPYLDEVVSVEEVDRDVFIPFSHRPLSRYINPLAERDCLLTKLLEPAPLAEFLVTSIAPDLEAAIPRLLVMRFERRRKHR